LKGLFLDKRHEDLLTAVEEIMATPAGRGWLDLQRYAVLAAERSGTGFQLVAKAIRSALRSLLQDLPGLVDATLMDDSPTASRDTMAWLGEEGLLPGPQPEGEDEAEARAKRGDRIIREAGYDRATAMAQGGDPQGAIELLMNRADHEGSPRARFLTKSAAAGIMVDHGMGMVARPLLDELLRLIEQHDLETWEPAEIVARPLSLFIRCLEPGEDHRREEIYPRLAKLDPVLAMQVARASEGVGEESDTTGGEEDYG
jgi:type VI secretion system protein ImpA